MTDNPADYREEDKSYAAYLTEHCIALGIPNHEYMDARGKEHMICLTMWKRKQAGPPSPKIINNDWTRPWDKPLDFDRD